MYLSKTRPKEAKESSDSMGGVWSRHDLCLVLFSSKVEKHSMCGDLLL